MPAAKWVKLTVAAVVFVVLLVVTIRGCDRPPPPPQPDNPVYRIDFPEGWMTRAPGGKLLIAVSPQEGPADFSRENIAVGLEQVEPGVLATDLLQRHIDAATSRLADAKVAQPTEAELAGLPAASAEFTFTIQAAPPLKDEDGDGKPDPPTEPIDPDDLPTQPMRAWMIATVDEHQRGFVITCTASAATFEGFRETFKQTVDSFVIQDPSMEKWQR